MKKKGEGRDGEMIENGPHNVTLSVIKLSTWLHPKGSQVEWNFA